MGVPEHFPICGIFVLLYFGVFVWDFLWRGGVILLPLHMTVVWGDNANGAGIPGTDQCH